MYTREKATDAATGASAAPQPGDSSASPAVNAKAEAECPDGKEVVCGCVASCRAAGTPSSSGLGRRTDHLPTVLMVAEASASEATPRTAALRARADPKAASATAAPPHSTPWFAARPSLGSTRSAPGQCRRATTSNNCRSHRTTAPCQVSS